MLNHGVGTMGKSHYGIVLVQNHPIFTFCYDVVGFLFLDGDLALFPFG